MKRWTPHPYQVEGVKFLLQNSNAGLFWSPGCGKTAVVLANLAALKMRGMLRRALVVAPRRPAKLVWPKERDKWLEFAGLTMDVLHGTKKNDILAKTKADICIITPEGLDWLLEEGKGRLAQLDPDVLVIDESSYFRTPGTKRFKNIKGILHRFKRRIILTATPAPKSYENLWSQIFILDMGGALGRFITHYRMLYFNNVANPGATYTLWGLKPGADKVINEKIKPMILREDAVDHLQMPQLIRNVIPVWLDDAAREVYEEMEKRFIVFFESGEPISAANAGVMINKLRQISNGFIYNGVHEPKIVHDAKVDAIVDLIDELQGQPVLILYEFQADRDRLLAALPGSKDLGAGISDAAADALCNEFNAGQLPVLMAHPASAGHGLNLQECSGHIIWFGPTWNLEHDEQATARVWRQGNTHERVFVHTFVVEDSVEEDVAHLLAQKDRTQKSLLAALKRRPQPVVSDAAA